MILHKLPRLLLDPAATVDPPAAPPADWKAGLPKELAEDPTIATIPDIATLAKNVVEQRKFIGLKRVAVPGKDWDDAKWGEWYELGGRPKAADEYVPAKVDLPEGMAADDARIKAAKEQAHKLGLNQKQFEGFTKWYLESEAEAFKSKSSNDALEMANSLKALKDEWRGDFDKNVDIARTALRQYADEDFMKFLDETKLGNNPRLLKAFHKIGAELVEDSARGNGPGLPVGDATSAKIEIGSLRIDAQFMAALLRREHPGHEAAALKWTQLHQRAYGTEPVS